MMIIHFDQANQRLWIANQRVHHGPLGLGSALLLALDKRLPLPERIGIVTLLFGWGLSDLGDYKTWFKREPWAPSPLRASKTGTE